MIKKIFDILFCDTQYGIAYKKKTDNIFTTVLPSSRYNYADPFMVEYDGNTAIFVELMDFSYGWGTIGVFEIKNGAISKVKEIIREDNHMSFPNVFLHDKELYMIPETHGANNIHMYKCVCFPFDWKYYDVLLNDVQIVDCSVIELLSTTYVVGYDVSINSSRVFKLNWELLKLEEIYPQGNYCHERPGGNFFFKNGMLKRVIQDCTLAYGDYIKIYTVEKIDDLFFEEKKDYDIKVNDYQFDIKKIFNHTHHYTQSEQYEVIDYNYQKFFFDKFFRYIYRIIKHPNRRFR